ncbi:MAG: hypothetical protein ACRC4T_05650 [Cetobacterium sp.]
MRFDYILIGILSFIAFAIWLIMKKISENATRCCGDCKIYEKCWNNSFDKDCYETPACSRFEERYSDFNRD